VRTSMHRRLVPGFRNSSRYALLGGAAACMLFQSQSTCRGDGGCDGISSVTIVSLRGSMHRMWWQGSGLQVCLTLGVLQLACHLNRNCGTQGQGRQGSCHNEQHMRSRPVGRGFDGMGGCDNSVRVGKKQRRGGPLVCCGAWCGACWGAVAVGV
jgi:hypothetical protein